MDVKDGNASVPVLLVRQELLLLSLAEGERKPATIRRTGFSSDGDQVEGK
jgi:hypothetical protein